ncbi:MAG: hypothetical protein HY731_06265 [Candidatus Tectomicrobia bacterium]|nr:hypothetical protein [Candidatus Tectomicrobia bacterium]
MVKVILITSLIAFLPFQMSTGLLAAELTPGLAQIWWGMSVEEAKEIFPDLAFQGFGPSQEFEVYSSHLFPEWKDGVFLSFFKGELFDLNYIMTVPSKERKTKSAAFLKEMKRRYGEVENSGGERVQVYLWENGETHIHLIISFFVQQHERSLRRSTSSKGKKQTSAPTLIQLDFSSVEIGKRIQELLAQRGR